MTPVQLVPDPYVFVMVSQRPLALGFVKYMCIYIYIYIMSPRQKPIVCDPIYLVLQWVLRKMGAIKRPSQMGGFRPSTF